MVFVWLVGNGPMTETAKYFSKWCVKMEGEFKERESRGRESRRQVSKHLPYVSSPIPEPPHYQTPVLPQ